MSFGAGIGKRGLCRRGERSLSCESEGVVTVHLKGRVVSGRKSVRRRAQEV